MPIRTKELCDKCEYGWFNHCADSDKSCKECDMCNPDSNLCRCSYIPQGTDCKYFTPKDSNITWGNTNDGCEHCRGRAYTEEPFEVITQLGAHVKTQFNFCPNCGRNMKGE